MRCSISRRIRRRLEASISEDHEHLYKLMEANKMKPCQITVNLREFKGQRFLDVTGYQPVRLQLRQPASSCQLDMTISIEQQLTVALWFVASFLCGLALGRW